MSNTKTPAAAHGKAGVVVVVVLVALVAAGVAATYILGASTDARVTHIQDADGATYDMPLGEDATLVVESSAGKNVVVVKGGAVCVSEADCPNLDCVHQGEISNAGQQIICLPHKLVVSITDGSGDASNGAAYDVVGS